MKDKKHIDRLFQEKFRDFEMTPPESSWRGIQERLPKSSKKRRPLPLWWSLGGVAASLLLGTLWWKIAHPLPTDGNLQPNATENPGWVQNPEIDPQTIDSQNSSATDKTSITNTTSSGNSQIVSSETVTTPQASVGVPSNFKVEKSIVSSETSNRSLKSKSSETIRINTTNSQGTTSSLFKKRNEDWANGTQTRTKSNSVLNQNQVEDPAESSNESSAFNTLNTLSAQDFQALVHTNLDRIGTMQLPIPYPMGEILHEKEEPLKASKEQKINRWQVHSYLAPIYLSSAGNGSPLDVSLAQNKKEAVPTYSYGVGVEYSINNRWSLRSGINALNTEYRTKDVSFSQVTSVVGLSHLESNSAGSMIQIESMESPVLMAASNVNAMAAEKLYGEISQRSSFIEIPLELSYKIWDGRLGLKAIGGFSTLLLRDDNVALISGGTQVTIGTADNINKTQWTSNLGLGLSYRLIKDFEFKIEPMFKYQWNAYRNSGNFKPYFFGLYTGLNYQF